jgi:phage portal protein BeeE
VSLLDRLMPKPAKASTGIGAIWMTNEPSLRSITGNPQDKMREAQEVATSNRWIRAAERVISHQFGTVPWHLETEDGESVTDESPEILKQIRDLIEKPYRVLEGDPISATPKTRAGLWSLTCRHTGVCGSSFWYQDETSVINGLPTSLLYINPARMTPVGYNNRLTGWVLDYNSRGGGTPLEAKSVLHFTIEEPDDGFFPPGLVETAMSSVNIVKHGDRHAGSTLASGGKRAMVYSPKAEAGILPPDIFAQLEKDLRAANEHPDATRRSIILRGPIDATPVAATPAELDLTSVMAMSRDDILALWGVPLSQLGAAVPAGLNSGSTKSFDEAALWQKAVGPRLERFREVLQFEFLDPIGQKIGQTLQLIVDVPTFDDEAPKYDIAVKAINLPLTNAERRALIGMDPFGNPTIDDAVWMPINIQEMVAAPVTDVPVKASLPIALRRSVDRLTPKIKKDLAAFLTTQQRDIAALVRKNAGHISSKPSDTDAWWRPDDWDAKLLKVLAPYATEIANLTVTQTKQALAPGKADFADIVGDKTLQAILKRLGLRIKGINETTRDRVATAIREGVEAGDGAAQLGDRIEAAAAFDEYRAELIARTESARALNESQIESYREFDVTTVLAIDGDNDEECAARDGQEFDLDEALAIEDHPNGTLDWSPVIGEPVAAKSAPVETPTMPTFGIPQITIPMDFDSMAQAQREQTEMLKALLERPDPQPVFNVPSPQINVAAPDPTPITVNVPEQAPPIVNVSTPEPVKASTDGIQEVRVVEMPSRRSTAVKRVKRDRAGLIVEVTEQEIEE